MKKKPLETLRISYMVFQKTKEKIENRFVYVILFIIIYSAQE